MRSGESRKTRKKPDTGIRTKGSFLPAFGFALVNLWGHVRIEIPCPALFPLPLSWLCRFFTINKMAKAIHFEAFKIIQYTIKRSKHIRLKLTYIQREPGIGELNFVMTSPEACFAETTYYAERSLKFLHIAFFSLLKIFLKRIFLKSIS